MKFTLGFRRLSGVRLQVECDSPADLHRHLVTQEWISGRSGDDGVLEMRCEDVDRIWPNTEEEE